MRGRRQNNFQGKNKGSNNNNNNSGFYKPKPYNRSFPKRPAQHAQQQGERIPVSPHQDRGKHLADKLRDKVLGLQSWAANTESPEKVQSVISAILAGVQENRQVLDESQDIFKSIVNALVFQKGVLEFSRRDSLDYFISRLVTEHTRNQLRNSQFSNRYCYDPDLCSKARKEYVDNKNLREMRGRRQNNFQGKNKGSNNNNNNSGFYKPKPYNRSFPKRPAQHAQQQGERIPVSPHQDRGKQQNKQRRSSWWKRWFFRNIPKEAQLTIN